MQLINIVQTNPPPTPPHPPPKKNFYNKQDEKAKKLIDKINKIVQINRSKSFACAYSNGKEYDFNKYKDINQCGHDTYGSSLLIKDPEYNQHEMNVLITKLNNYNPTNEKKK